MINSEIIENKVNFNKENNEQAYKNSNFDSFYNISRNNKNEFSRNLINFDKNNNENSNKFLNKIKITSKEKYISNKIVNPDQRNNLSLTINNLLSVSLNYNKNLNQEKNYNLNTMRTAHLKVDNIFHNDERSNQALGKLIY